MDETFNWFILNQSNTRKSFEQTQSQARIASLCDQHQKACVCVKKILNKKSTEVGSIFGENEFQLKTKISA